MTVMSCHMTSGDCHGLIWHVTKKLKNIGKWWEEGIWGLSLQPNDPIFIFLFSFFLFLLSYFPYLILLILPILYFLSILSSPILLIFFIPPILLISFIVFIFSISGLLSLSYLPSHLFLFFVHLFLFFSVTFNHLLHPSHYFCLSHFQIHLHIYLDHVFLEPAECSVLASCSAFENVIFSCFFNVGI